VKKIVESAFVKMALLATGGVILFFIFFTMIFSGKRHLLFDPSGFDWSWFNLGIFLNELVVPLVILLVGLLIWALSHFFGQRECK